jgi:NAD(P)-dependent dehydrogenase (short-subunit alcohol dehydrogenase family)
MSRQGRCVALAAGLQSGGAMGTIVSLITGASTGIGQVTALHLARAGHDVHATMRSPERGAPLLESAKTEGLKLTVSQLDVTEPASVEKAVALVLAKAGRIDVLINNAGIGNLGALENCDEDDVRMMFETNVSGPLRMIRAVLPGMRERGSGTIVNISSVAGRFVGGGNGIYCATKYALEAASETLAIEVKQFGIRVAIVEPGFFSTPIIDKAVDATGAHDAEGPYANIERRISGVYLGGKEVAGDPQEVAVAIEEAITTDDPKLRYLVGASAAPFIEGRARMSDEEYVHAFGRVMTDEDYFTEFAARFPMPSSG